eukprot:Skav201839  [mRNA]  locus=scaffold484:234207:238497:- [translate_table: standard]
MVEYLSVGMKLHAMYTDGEYYPAEVVNLSTSAKKKKNPVKVHYNGYDASDDAWCAIHELKCKALPKEAKAPESPPHTAGRSAATQKRQDYSGLTKGMRLQAKADGKYWAAEAPGRLCRPNLDERKLGDTMGQYDEWLGADRLRSKAIVPMSKEGGAKAAFGAVMPQAAKKLLLVKPKVKAPLDPGFCPLILAKKKYLEAAKDCKDALEDKLTWALPRADGCGRYSLPVFADGTRESRASAYLAGAHVGEMIWQRSAGSLILHGPPKICKFLEKCYSVGWDRGAYEFEVTSMPKVCGTPDKAFEVKIVESESEIPEGKDTPQVCGKDASGCRLAFDLGKSDIKTVAVKDGH